MGMWVNQTDGGQFLVNCVTNGVGHGFSGLMGGVMVGYYRFGCGHRVNHRFDHTLQNLVANGGGEPSVYGVFVCALSSNDR